MVSASYPPLEWARALPTEQGKRRDEWSIGYIIGFMNADMPDVVTRQYVKNVMYARLRGVSA